MRTAYPKRRDVRWEPDLGWVMACERCRDLGRACWWLIDAAFWNHRRGLQICRACYNDIDRARRRARNSPDEIRKRWRDYYYRTRRDRLAWKRANYQKNREHIRALARARYAAKKGGANAGPTMEEVAGR